MAQLFPDQLFPFGQLVITRVAKDELDPESVLAAIKRHAKGDWGDLDQEDKDANDEVLLDGSRLLSAYQDRQGTKFWIITEADRSATTVLLPSDY